jgi:hypothetical protein
MMISMTPISSVSKWTIVVEHRIVDKEFQITQQRGPIHLLISKALLPI